MRPGPGAGSDEIVRKIELLINQIGVEPGQLPLMQAALEKEERTGGPAAAMQLADGRIVTGKTTDLMGCSSTLLLNALKVSAGIAHEIDLISPQVLAPICQLKTGNLGNRTPGCIPTRCSSPCISAVTNPVAAMAMEQLPKLKGCDAHFSVIPSGVDERLYKKLACSCQPASPGTSRRRCTTNKNSRTLDEAGFRVYYGHKHGIANPISCGHKIEVIHKRLWILGITYPQKLKNRRLECTKWQKTNAPITATPVRPTVPAARRRACWPKPTPHSRVKKVIGVVSGKGGVGKSMVTSLMAVTMNRRGLQDGRAGRGHYRPLHSPGRSA